MELMTSRRANLVTPFFGGFAIGNHVFGYQRTSKKGDKRILEIGGGEKAQGNLSDEDLGVLTDQIQALNNNTWLKVATSDTGLNEKHDQIKNAAEQLRESRDDATVMQSMLQG